MPVAQTASSSAARELTGFAAIIGLCLLFAGAKPILHDTMDPDFFWHMRVADQLHQDGFHPLVDKISFASIKKPWTPYSWFGELCMKRIWDHTGLRGAILTQAGLQAIFVLLVVLCCFQRTKPSTSTDSARPLFPIVLTTVLATYISLPYLSFRPVLVAIDLLGVCVVLLLRDRRLQERSYAVWALPFLTALTINIHLFAIFVPIWIGALLAGAVMERDRRAKKRYGILLAACLAACFCTPMAGGTFAVIREYLTANPLTSDAMIAELEPMYRGLGNQFTLCVVSIVILCAIARRSLRAGEWVWLAGMFLLWIKCGRAGPMFAMIFAAAMSGAIPPLRDHPLGNKWVNFAAVTVILIGLIRITFSLPDNHHPEAWLNRRGDDFAGYPTAAAEYVASNVHSPTGHLINEFDWGGYLAWKLPTYQVLLDGRTQLYTPEFWRAAYLGDRDETTQFLAAIDADAAILPAGKSRFRESLQELDWKRVHYDARAEVWVPPITIANDGS